MVPGEMFGVAMHDHMQAAFRFFADFGVEAASALLGWCLHWATQKAKKRYIQWRFFRRIRWVLPVSDEVDDNTPILYVKPSLEVIRSGAKGVKSKRAYTHSCETVALAKLSSFLDDLPMHISFDYQRDMGMQQENWLLLGLSRNNVLSKSLLTDLEGSPISSISFVEPENDHYFFRDQDGNEYKCKHKKDDNYESVVTSDHGIIYRKTMDNGAQVLLCGGIHMHGTQAALEVALSQEFQKEIQRRRCKEFVQMIHVRVLDDGLRINAASIQWRGLPFTCLDHRRAPLLKLIQKFARYRSSDRRPQFWVDAKKDE